MSPESVHDVDTMSPYGAPDVYQNSLWDGPEMYLKCQKQTGSVGKMSKNVYFFEIAPLQRYTAFCIVFAWLSVQSETAHAHYERFNSARIPSRMVPRVSAFEVIHVVVSFENKCTCMPQLRDRTKANFSHEQMRPENGSIVQRFFVILQS